MSRLQRTLGVALSVLFAGGGLAAWVYFERYTKVPDERREAAAARRLFSWGRFSVQSVRVESQRATFSAVCSEQYGCRLVSPVRGPSDREAMTALLDNVAALPLAIELAVGDEAKAKLAEYGLSPAPITLTASTSDGKTHVLYVGQTRPIDGRRYVAGGDPLRLGLADDVFYWTMNRDFSAFRAKQVFELTPNEIDEIVVERMGDAPHSLSLRRAEPLWSVTADGRTLPADPFVLERFVILLTRDLKADAFVTDAYTAEQAPTFGLDRPAFAVTVSTSGGNRVRALVGVAPRPEGTGEPSEVGKAAPFVHIEGSSSVAVVYNELLSDLSKGLPEFRDRRITDFDLELVRRIEILREGKQRFVLDGAGSSWQLLEPEVGPARTDRAQNIALRYSKLRAARVIDDDKSPAKLKSMGLDPPEQRVILRADGGRILADIRFGKPVDKDHLAVTAEGMDRIDAVRDAELRLLPLNVDDILRRGAP